LKPLAFSRALILPENNCIENDRLFDEARRLQEGLCVNGVRDLFGWVDESRIVVSAPSRQGRTDHELNEIVLII
jgi:hypothetical protein